MNIRQEHLKHMCRYIVRLMKAVEQANAKGYGFVEMTQGANKAQNFKCILRFKNRLEGKMG